MSGTAITISGNSNASNLVLGSANGSINSVDSVPAVSDTTVSVVPDSPVIETSIVDTSNYKNWWQYSSPLSLFEFRNFTSKVNYVPFRTGSVLAGALTDNILKHSLVLPYSENCPADVFIMGLYYGLIPDSSSIYLEKKSGILSDETFDYVRANINGPTYIIEHDLSLDIVDPSAGDFYVPGGVMPNAAAIARAKALSNYNSVKTEWTVAKFKTLNDDLKSKKDKLDALPMLIINGARWSQYDILRWLFGIHSTASFMLLELDNSSGVLKEISDHMNVNAFGAEYMSVGSPLIAAELTKKNASVPMSHSIIPVTNYQQYKSGSAMAGAILDPIMKDTFVLPHSENCPADVQLMSLYYGLIQDTSNLNIDVSGILSNRAFDTVRALVNGPMYLIEYQLGLDITELNGIDQYVTGGVMPNVATINEAKALPIYNSVKEYWTVDRFVQANAILESHKLTLHDAPKLKVNNKEWSQYDVLRWLFGIHATASFMLLELDNTVGPLKEISDHMNLNPFGSEWSTVGTLIQAQLSL